MTGRVRGARAAWWGAGGAAGMVGALVDPVSGCTRSGLSRLCAGGYY